MFVTRNVFRKFMAPQSGEGGEGGGGSAEGSGEGKGAGAEGSGEGGEPAAKGGEGTPGGERKPSDEEARLLKENMKRKEDLRAAQNELANLKKQFDGIDPEAVRKLLDSQREQENKQLEAKGDFDRLKARMAEEHGKQVSALQSQIDALQATLGKSKGTINELTIGTAFGQSKFVTEEMTMTPAKARVVYADYFDLGEDGTVTGYDKPRGAASRTALVDQYGNAVPFDAALRKIVEADPEKDFLLRSKVKPGAGSETRRGPAPVQKETGGDSVSKIAAGLKGLAAA